MKNQVWYLFVCLGLAACKADTTAVMFQPGKNPRSAAIVSESAVNLPPEETKLIAELVNSYPPDKRDLIARAFSDPFMVGAKTPQNARNQAIIDRIDAIRRLRIDSATKAEKQRGRSAVAATVILLPALQDSTASAVVWRRSRQLPHDVIVLRSDRATVGSLGAALRVLTKLRKESGDSPTTDEHAVVHGEHVPNQWQGDMRAFVAADLEQLRASAPRSIAPFGIVRSRDVWLTATHGNTP